MTETLRSIAIGLALGAVSAAVLSVFTRNALPRVHQMKAGERIACVVFVVLVMLASIIATAAVAEARWLQLSSSNARRVLFVAWFAPVAFVVNEALRRNRRLSPTSAPTETTVGALRTVTWGLQLFLFIILAAAAVALWVSGK
jgi:hypothetical protein